MKSHMKLIFSVNDLFQQNGANYKHTPSAATWWLHMQRLSGAYAAAAESASAWFVVLTDSRTFNWCPCWHPHIAQSQPLRHIQYV